MNRSSNSRVWNWARTRIAASSRRPPAVLDRLQLLADPARLLGPVPDADHLDLVALVLLGPQRLAEPAGILRDQAGGGGEDVGGRAVILLEADDLRAREILLEAQDVGDLGAAPGIDRLVVVADAADVLALLREQAEPEILGLVGVLIFVDEDVFEALLIDARARRGASCRITSMCSSRSPKSQALSSLQPRLVDGVELGALAVGIGLGLAGIDLVRASSPCSSSGRSSRRAAAPASVSRRCRRRRSAASSAAAGRRCRGW